MTAWANRGWTARLATLNAFNPNVEVEAVPENVGESNAAGLVAKADIVFSAAPLFEERLLLNRECVRQGKPLVDCAMFNLEGRVIPILPRKIRLPGLPLPGNSARLEAAISRDWRGFRPNRQHRRHGGNQAAHRPGRLKLEPDDFL